jgi:multidrug transporter EmrE-like cation transporter
MIATISAFVLASILYVSGGVAMKYSQGLQAAIPTFIVLCSFCAGAAVQTWGMKNSDLGVGYVFVLGMEGILAVLAGIIFFQEPFTTGKVMGILLVMFGTILLKV